MKKVATHDSLAFIGYMKNVLDQSGIACILRNEQLAGGLGEIPFLECMPELWVLEDSDLDRAASILAELKKPADNAGPWSCSSCGEVIDGQFAVCWNCGAETPAA